MIIEFVLGAAFVIAAGVAVVKHFGLTAVEAEISTIKADLKTAVTKAEATVATIKADLEKYL
jgi:hypothetical protein